MSGSDRPAGAWVKDAETAVGLINDIEWSASDDEMRLLRELSYVADGEREKVRFEVGDRDE